MTDNEIIKAYEFCLNNKDCIGCVADKHSNSDEFDCLLKPQDIIDLFNRLQAENRVKDYFEKLVPKQKEIIDKQEADIERLKPFEDKIAEFKSHIRVEDMLVCANSLDEWLEFCDNLKAEAYKEFAERLKKHRRIEHQWVVPETAIDNILKELVGENK